MEEFQKLTKIITGCGPQVEVTFLSWILKQNSSFLRRGHRIESALAPRRAAQKPPGRKSPAFKKAVYAERFKRVARTRGIKAAVMPQHRRDEFFVAADQQHAEARRQFTDTRQAQASHLRENLPCAGRAPGLRTLRAWRRRSPVQKASARTTSPVLSRDGGVAAILSAFCGHDCGDWPCPAFCRRPSRNAYFRRGP